MISLSGGACSDVVSVAASLYRRGVGVIRIPTSLIGQVDAAIGIKGAINHGRKKNSLGVYYPPISVIINARFLSTLDRREVRNGLAEVLKIGLIRDPELFRLATANAEKLLLSRFQEPQGVAEQIVRSAGLGMLDELEPNLFEDQTYERKVDLGHSVSPLLEITSGFSLRHGEAVAIDIAFSAACAQLMGKLSLSDFGEILTAIQMAELPISSLNLRPELCHRAFLDASAHRGGNSNIVLPSAVGGVEIVHSSDSFRQDLVSAAIAMLARAPHCGDISSL
jgi:3-dehydroquinate synthase